MRPRPAKDEAVRPEDPEQVKGVSDGWSPHDWTRPSHLEAGHASEARGIRCNRGKRHKGWRWQREQRRLDDPGLIRKAVRKRKTLVMVWGLKWLLHAVDWVV
jgi:hypothetical protein